MTTGAPASLDAVLELYETWGHDHYDEALSQLDHALQTAALAQAADAPDPLVAAALLHDVGHLLELAAREPSQAGDSATADLAHEATGAAFLAPLFPAAVTAPIALHVRAKRYRCAVDEAYQSGLSDGSRASLALQGGPFDADDVAAFERNPGFEDAVRLREWDDRGKVDSLAVASLEHYRPLLQRLVRPEAAST